MTGTGQALDRVTQIAMAIPASIARAGPKPWSAELARRLTIRGWIVRQRVKLEKGTRGDDTHRSGQMDTLAYPPDDPRPVLVEVERNQVSWKTRAKLIAWGQRPHQGIIVIVLYQPAADPCPEASMTLALGHKRQRWPRGLTKLQQERKLRVRSRGGRGGFAV